LSGRGYAHSALVLTVKTEFGMNGEFVISVHVDPRLILFPNPKENPPLLDAWWLEKDEAQRAVVAQQTRDFIQKAFAFTVGNQELKALKFDCQAMCGENASPVLMVKDAVPVTTAKQQELHFKAVARGHLPAETKDFQLKVQPTASTVTVLLNSYLGQQEHHPQVLFPGEQSRSFSIVQPTAAAVTH
jgi:hypothetical protein